MTTDTTIQYWPLPDTGADLPSSLHPVLRRIYQARGVRVAQETEHGLEHLNNFRQLRQIDVAANLLADAVCNQQRILIVGDYDADGATSCALGMRALRAMGARDVDYLVPNRFEFGYGLTPEIVALAKQRKPALLVTVDNGIASIDGVEAAKAAGMRVIITDHHLPGDRLPVADAIVNPNQPGDGFPSKHLAGVGVMFYVMAALRATLRERGWFAEQGLQDPKLANYLDLVALGTVADVVKLDHNNRVLVAQGLARMRAGQACPGIHALLQVAGRDYRQVSSTDLGFFVGPRLNAAGRLDDISIGIECLLSNDPDTALARAQVLDDFNRERRKIEQGMRIQAQTLLERLFGDTDTARLPATITLYDDAFHEGVIGILAGRIKEQFHRPVIVFAKSADGMIKGSARSIPGLHIRDTLDLVATRRPELLSKFGGHAMAAGLSIRETDFDAFSDAFMQAATEHLDDDALQRVLHCDGQLDSQDITLQFAELLRASGPWGQGFPEPRFEGRFDVVQRRIVGEHHLKLLLRQGTAHFDAIAFRTTDHDWPQQVSSVHLVYRLDVNEYNGQRNAQLLIDYIRPLSDAD